MRSLSIFFLLLLSLTLLGYVISDGPEEYWKRKMNGNPMPKALRDLLHEDFPTEKNTKRNNKFLRDFDMKANIIIYHNDVDIYPKRPRPTPYNDDHYEEEAQRRKTTLDP
ncbi:hypothetical protein HAX54_031206 [Datura stramonium]|uniref:Uncharacterized protein n=1 Tax=Datura stramonium TaxID=4076 RepID=A0ABS8V8U3_DATST|nr:hypothetical protein [Datura stramonium]